jgi:hypothetical protein
MMVLPSTRTADRTPPARTSYMGRFRIDPDMGEIFTWITSLQPTARSREVAHLLRLGFEFRNLHGRIPLITNSGGLAISEDQNKPSITMGVTSPPKTVIEQNSSREMHELGFDSDFLKPKRETGHHQSLNGLTNLTFVPAKSDTLRVTTVI